MNQAWGDNAMPSYAVSVLMVLVGLIHLVPAVGVFAPERLRTLYGIGLDAPDLVLLMRHRALLFALLGGFIILAAFRPALQPLAFGAATLSMGGFLLLAAGGGHGEAIMRIVRADGVGMALLALAFTFYCLQPE